MIEAELRDRQSGIYDFIRFECVETMLDEFFAGRSELVAKIWFVFMFDLWEKCVHRQREESEQESWASL